MSLCQRPPLFAFLPLGIDRCGAGAKRETCTRCSTRCALEVHVFAFTYMKHLFVTDTIPFRELDRWYKEVRVV